MMNLQVASAAKHAWIVFCAMPQGDGDTERSIQVHTKILVTVDTLLLGQIWFWSVI